MKKWKRYLKRYFTTDLLNLWRIEKKIQTAEKKLENLYKKSGKMNAKYFWKYKENDENY